MQLTKYRDRQTERQRDRETRTERHRETDKEKQQNITLTKEIIEKGKLGFIRKGEKTKKKCN